MVPTTHKSGTTLPTLEKTMKRAEQLKFRATPEEKAAIQRLAELAGMSLQDYLLTQALGTTSQSNLVPLQSYTGSTIEPFGTKKVCVCVWAIE